MTFYMKFMLLLGLSIDIFLVVINRMIVMS